MNDSTAISLLNTAVRLGVRVPEELSVVGFDDLHMSTQIQFPLTTISLPLVDIGAKTAHLLLDRIEGRGGPPEHMILPTGLVVRESCGARHNIRGAIDG